MEGDTLARVGYLAIILVALGGWVGARLAMAGMAGLLAALTAWVAIRRFGVSARTAVLTVGALAVTAPLVGYGSQVYPELPAALAVMVAVAGLTGELSRRCAWMAANTQSPPAH